MMIKVNVSIIIPTYNRLWSLPKAIDSCRQTNIDTELIVIDDGSTDGTWDWLQSQPGIIVLRQENLGKCQSVNRGIELATGEYIRFLDSDDMLAPYANDEQYWLAKQTDADIVVAGYKTIDVNDHVIKEQQWVNCDDFIAQQLGECDSSHYSAFLFKKKNIKDIPHRSEFALRDDRLFMLEVALKEPTITIYDDYALLHRAHLNERLQINTGIKSITQNYQHYNLYKRILNELEKSGRLTERYKKAPSNILWHLAHWVAKTNIRVGFEIYNWLYELNPAFVPTENLNIARLYKILGFKKTEQLLRFRRILK